MSTTKLAQSILVRHLVKLANPEQALPVKNTKQNSGFGLSAGSLKTMGKDLAHGHFSHELTTNPLKYAPGIKLPSVGPLKNVEFSPVTGQLAGNYSPKASYNTNDRTWENASNPYDKPEANPFVGPSLKFEF
jgi:hypothetical protein